MFLTSHNKLIPKNINKINPKFELSGIVDLKKSNLKKKSFSPLPYSKCFVLRHPNSLKFMPKMRQNTFGGLGSARTRWGA